MKSTQTLSQKAVTAALIAAAYAVLTYLSAAMGLAYGSIQFRLSEALNVLALFTPAAVPGLTLGCVIGNITSPFGPIDILSGAAATCLSAVCIRLLSKLSLRSEPFLAVLPPVVFNAVTVGLVATAFLPEGITLFGFLLSAGEVALGEVAVCAALGVPFYYIIKKRFGALFRTDNRGKK